MSTIIQKAKGDTAPFTVTVPHTTLSAADGLGSYTGLVFYGKLSVTDADADAVFKKTLSDGVTITTPGDNTTTDAVVTIALDPADTSSLPDVLGNISIYCSLKGNDGSDHEYTIAGTPDAPIILLVGMTPTSKVTV